MNVTVRDCCFNTKISLHRDKRIIKAAGCTVKGTLDAMPLYLSQLHFYENNYYNSLKFDKRKESYLLGRTAAKNAVAQLISPEKVSSVYIDFGVFQFAVVKGLDSPNLQVSISHATNIAVALAFEEEHPMGIDIEKINEDRDTAIKMCINETEYRILEACDLHQSVGYTIAWSVKEAISKVLRTGMMVDFLVLEIDSIRKDDVFYYSTFKYFKQYKAITFHTYGYVCTVVLPKNTDPQLMHFFDAFAHLTQQG